MIISFLALKHIKENTDIETSEIIKILNDICKTKMFKNTKIYFYYYTLNPNKKNADSFFYRIIRVNSAWAINVINNSKNTNVMDAFRITIGHELGHKQKHINRLFHLLNLKFFSWVQEVYCDFYGTSAFANKEKNKLISSIIYKIQDKDQNYSDISHPSWNKRLEYAKIGSFNDKLIIQIYKDSGCKNKRALNKALNFYKNRFIILK